MFNMGLADSTEFSRLAEEIARMALNSPNPGEIIGRYQQNPDTKLAAFLANGIVQAQLGAKDRQQALQGYNPNQPTVLDQMGQQGVAALPVPDTMFDPEMHQQGMAGGGVIAFSGEGPSLVEPDDTLKKIRWGESRGRNVVNPATGASGPGQMVRSTFDLLQKKYPTLQAVSWDDYKAKPDVQDQVDMTLLEDQRRTLANLGIPNTLENHAVVWFGGPKLAKAPDDAPIEKVFSKEEVKKNPWTAGKTVGEVKYKVVTQMQAPQPETAPQATSKKTSPEDEAVGQAYEGARAWRRKLESNVPRNLAERGQWEAQVAAAKDEEAKAKAAWEGTPNYKATDKRADPRVYAPAMGVGGVGKSPEYFAAKQEALQANPPEGYNALEYGAGIPSLVTPPAPGKTPVKKPVVPPSLQERYMEATPSAAPTVAAAPAKPPVDNTWMQDAGLAMIRGGLGTMASRNPARGLAGALQSFGEGNVPALEGFVKLRQARDAAEAQRGEKASDRLLKAQEIASNQVKNAITLQLGLIKQDIPGFDTPETKSALAHAMVISRLPDVTRKLAGYTDEDYKQAMQVLARARSAGALGGVGNSTGGLTPAQEANLERIRKNYPPKSQ